MTPFKPTKSWAFFVNLLRKPRQVDRSRGEPGGIHRDIEGDFMTQYSTHSFGQPSLTDLMVRFLATRSDAASGAAVEPAEGEVEPYEVAAGFRVDPRATWTDAIAPLATGPTQFRPNGPHSSANRWSPSQSPWRPEITPRG
jgi:hypothetical protein